MGILIHFLWNLQQEVKWGPTT